MKLRYVVRALSALVIALVPTLGPPLVTPPAHAGPTPWAFGPITYTEAAVASGVTGQVVGDCPSGYVALGGGFDTTAPLGAIERVAEYRATVDGRSAWVVLIHNFYRNTIFIRAFPVCANAAQVGAIETVGVDVPRNGTTFIAGGQATCPEGKVAIGGGADWNSFDPDRRIDTTAPTLDGRGWMVSGWIDVDVTLHVEAYCVALSGLGVSAPQVESQDFEGGGTFSHETVCGTGKRSATGGVITSPAGVLAPDPTVYRAVQEQSHQVLPLGNGTAIRWFDHGRVEGGTRVIYSVWCLPASQPVVTITSGPPPYTNSTSATFSFEASDPAGEPLNRTCSIDGDFAPCPSSPTTLSQLPEGTHTFEVRVENESRFQAAESHTWTIDLTAPQVTVPAARIPLTGPIRLTFDEPVRGVSSSSLQVRVAGTSTALPGTVTLDAAKTTATWKPVNLLVPGETYAVSTTTAIKDRAGNALTPDTHLLRATGVVESASPVLRETWDVDRAAAADGGGFAAAWEGGASASWRFSAASGQKAVVYGVLGPTGGYADVYVDGVKRARASFYRSATLHQAPVFTSAALTAGQHTLEVRVLGTKPSASSGTWVGLDAIRVGGTDRQESLATFRFRRVAVGAASGGSYDTVGHATDGDTGPAPAYSLTFKGSAVAVRATRSPGSGSARVYIDGVLRRTVSLRASTTTYQVLVASITGLAEVRHTLRIVPVGTATGAGSAVGIDRIDVS